MKRLLIVFSLFVPALINAQTFWNLVNDDINHNISHVTDKGLFQDSMILVSGFVSDASCPNHHLFAYNMSGQRLWNINGYHDLIYANSDFIYTAGYTPIDDVLGIEQIVISKYDKNGNEVFSIGYPETPHNFYFEFEPKSIDLTDDGRILVSSTNAVVKLNMHDLVISEYKLTLETNINSVTSTNPSSYLITTKNNIYKSDSSLVLADSVEFSNNIKDLLIENDTVYTLFDSYLIRLDTNLNIIDTIIASSPGLANIEIYDNSIWCQSLSPDSVKLFNLQQSQIQDSLAFPVLLNDIQFIVSRNNFTFLGNSFTDQIGMYQFQTINNEVETPVLPDIELVNFEIGNIVFHYGHFLEDSFATGYNFDTELTIKNNGEDTLVNFAVYSDLHGGENCAQNYFYQKFTDLEILPGQTQILSLRRAYEEGINNNQLCFNCLAPNSELEIIAGNNSLCKTFEITDIENLSQSKIKIYPNPFDNFLMIEQPEIDNLKIEIFDSNGKILISKVLSGQKTTIVTDHLSAGLYLIKIYSGSKIKAELILKE